MKSSASAAAAATPIPTPIWRKQNPISSGGTVGQQVVKLNKTLVYRQLQLQLTATPTLTAANNTAANTALGDEWGALSNFQLQANGSDVFRNFSGDDLWWLNWFWYQMAPRVTSTLADATTANPAIDSTLIVPFWYPQSFHPFDTVLNSGRFNDFQALATFASFTGINSAATAWTAAPQIALTSHEQLLPADPDDMPKLNWVVKKLSNIPGGANTAYRVLLDAGVNYTRFLINIKNAAGTADAGSVTSATAASSLVTNVKVVGAGGRVYVDRSYNELNQECKLRKGMLQSVSRRGNASASDAWIEIDLCPDGRLKEAMPNPNDAFLEFAVAANCQINVFPSIIFPVG